MTEVPSDPYGFCEAVVRESDREAWLAALFAPSALRPSLHALDALRIEIGHVRARVTQPLAGEIRLQWWRDAILGEARGEAGANPLAAAVVDTIRRHALPAGVIDEALDARRIELYGEPLPTMEALEDRLAATRGSFVSLAATVLAEPEGASAEAARHAGIALGLRALLEAFGEDPADGGAALPTAVLARHGLRPEDLATGGKPGLANALADLRGSARQHLAAFAARRDEVTEAAAPAFLRLALVEPSLRWLDRQQRRDPLAPVRPLPPWRRHWLLWRAARRGRIAG